MNYLLYSHPTRYTGQALARFTGVAAYQGQPLDASDTLIRWGSTLYSDSDAPNELNHSLAIQAATNKFESLQRFKEYGVTVPPFSLDWTELQFPMLGRAHTHSRGRDIILYLQRKDVERYPSEYYIQYVPKVREYRIHVFRGEPFISVIKVIKPGCESQAAKQPWSWNHGQGFQFVTPVKRPAPARLDMAVQAVECLGLDFGAVDLIIGEDGEQYVLEVNSAPGLEGHTLDFYAEKIQEWQETLELVGEASR